MSDYKEHKWVDFAVSSQTRIKWTVQGIFNELNKVNENRNTTEINDYISKLNINTTTTRKTCAAYVSEPYLKNLKWESIKEYASSKQGCVGVYGHDQPYSEFEILKLWQKSSVDQFLQQQEKLSKESQFQKESLSQERPFVIYASPDVSIYDNLSQILRALKSNHTDIDSIMHYIPLTACEIMLAVLQQYYNIDCVQKNNKNYTVIQKHKHRLYLFYAGVVGRYILFHE